MLQIYVLGSRFRAQGLRFGALLFKDSMEAAQNSGFPTLTGPLLGVL